MKKEILGILLGMAILGQPVQCAAADAVFPRTHEPGLFLSPQAGLPVPGPDVIFQLKRGDEPWLVEFHGFEGKEGAENVSLGN